MPRSSAKIWVDGNWNSLCNRLYCYNFLDDIINIWLLMPKAKKSQLVSLTKVKPKTREHKEYIVEKVHLFLKKFKYVYVLTYENMTTNNFKAFKETLNDSKFLMGKNKVMGVAFGTSEENSFLPNSFRIGELLKGHCTLFFTNRNY